jgi:hypothetical protein
MAIDFSKRIKKIPTEYFLNFKNRDALISKTIKEYYVFVFEYYALNYLNLNSEPLVNVRKREVLDPVPNFMYQKRAAGLCLTFCLLKMIPKIIL